MLVGRFCVYRVFETILKHFPLFLSTSYQTFFNIFPTVSSYFFLSSPFLFQSYSSVFACFDPRAQHHRTEVEKGKLCLHGWRSQNQIKKIRTVRMKKFFVTLKPCRSAQKWVQSADEAWLQHFHFHSGLGWIFMIYMQARNNLLMSSTSLAASSLSLTAQHLWCWHYQEEVHIHNPSSFFFKLFYFILIFLFLFFFKC